MYNGESRRSKTGFGFSPILLIILGIVFLLNNFGLLPWEIWQNIWKFWPVLLILFAVEVLLGRSSSLKTILFLVVLIFLLPIVLILNPLTGNPLATQSLVYEKPLGNLTKTEIQLNLPSNNLELVSLEQDSDKALVSTVKYSKLLPETEILEERRFGEAKYNFNQPQRYFPFSDNLGNSVKLKLSRLIPHSLYLKSTTGVFDINLESLNIPLLEIDSGASQIEIRYAKNTINKTFIKATAAKITLKLPTELSVELKIDSAIKEVKINESRFRKKENSYISLNSNPSNGKVQIEVSGSASSVEIK